MPDGQLQIIYTPATQPGTVTVVSTEERQAAQDAQLGAEQARDAALAAQVAAEAAQDTFTAPANDVVATMVTDPGPTKTALSVFGRYLPQFHGIRYTAYGHSFGQVQIPPNTYAGSLYPNRLRDLLRVDTALYQNLTVSGSTMNAIAARAASTWVDGNGGLLTIMGNQNSVGAQATETSFKTDFRAFLRTIRGGSAHPPTLLVIKDTTCTAVGYARYATPPTDADVARFNGYLDDVIAEFPAGWIAVADPMGAGWDPATMTAPDGQHPNDRGMALIASACLDALSKLGYRQGQNVGVVSANIGLTLQDTFTRADSATTLGTADTGQVWSTTAGTYGIASNKAYRVGDGSAAEGAFALVTATADLNVSITFNAAVTGGGAGPVFRATDGANGWVVDCTSTGTKLYKRVGGTYTMMADCGAAVPAGAIVRVSALGSDIKVYVNGVLKGSVTDSFNATAVKAGIRIVPPTAGGASDVRLDDFTVTTAA